MLNESLEYRKILSFKTCSMLNQSNPSACTLQAERAMWIKTLYKKELKMPLMNGLKCQVLVRIGWDGASACYFTSVKKGSSMNLPLYHS